MIRDKLRTHLVSLKSGTRGRGVKKIGRAEVHKIYVFGPPQAEFLGDLKNYFKESLLEHGRRFLLEYP